MTDQLASKDISPRWPWATLSLLASLALFYAGERVASGQWRYAVSGAAIALFLLGTLGLAAWRMTRLAGQRRVAYQRLLVDYGLCAVALVLYVIQTDDVGLLKDGATRDVLRLLSPTFLLAGLLPAMAIELSLRSAGNAPTLEGWRFDLAHRGARIIVLAIAAFAGFNYAANKWNRKIDLSYFKTSEVGTSNQAMMESLTKPVVFYLFFPPGNEVLENARAYIDELARHSKLASVEVVDQALSPDLARELKVRTNGYLVIKSGDQSETMRLGLDMEGADTTLRTLDTDMQERLTKLLRPARVAYLTTGHLERDFSPPADDERRGLTDFRQLLTSLGFTTKRLGLGEGLGSEIPDDATVVIIAGPTEPFLPAERQAIERYLNKGGRLLVFMDPDHGKPDNELLAPLGVQVSETLASCDNLHYLWRIEGQGDSPYNITTNNVSSHPSVTTFGRNRTRLAALLSGSGQVVKRDDAAVKWQSTAILRSMTDCFVDDNKTGKFEPQPEKRATLDLAIAIAAKNDDDKKPSTRAVIFGDTDFIGDLILRNQGNYIIIMDTLRWLAGDTQSAGTVESEKDVRISHRKDEDRIWFYGSSVLVPAGVLLAGLLYTRRTRKSGNRK